MGSERFPGDTTARDWSDREWWFWFTDDHGCKGIARTKKERGISGRTRPTDKVRATYCKEHNSWEITRRRTTGKRALARVLERSPDAREPRKEPLERSP